MNEDGTRDVDEEDEDELASPSTLLRRILQRDSHALTAGFEVSSREPGACGRGRAHGLPCVTVLACTYVAALFKSRPNRIFASPHTCLSHASPAATTSV